MCFDVFFCVAGFNRKNPQQVFQRHRPPGLSAAMDVCGLHPGESHLARFACWLCSAGRPFHAWLNLLCGARPLIWKQLLWDYLPARPSAFADLIKVPHRLRVRRRGSHSATQHGRPLQRMCTQPKKVIGRGEKKKLAQRK